MSGRKLVNGSGALGFATVAVPVRPKSSGAWSIASRKIAYYDGETAADAATFAEIIAASADRFADAYANRRAPCGFDASYVPQLSPNPGQSAESFARMTAEAAAERAERHARLAAAVPARGAVTAAMVARRNFASQCLAHHARRPSRIPTSQL